MGPGGVAHYGNERDSEDLPAWCAEEGVQTALGHLIWDMYACVVACVAIALIDTLLQVA